MAASRWAAAAAAGSIALACAAAAPAQPAHPAAKPKAGAPALGCVYDALTPSAREEIGAQLLQSDSDTPAFRAAATKLKTATHACRAAPGWSERRADISESHAMWRMNFEAVERDNVAAGLAGGKLKAAWIALSPADREVMREESYGRFAIVERVSAQLDAGRGPGKPRFAMVPHALTSLSYLAAAEADWKKP